MDFTLTLVTVRQVIVLFLLMLAACVCVRAGWLAAEDRRGFSNLLIYLVAPAMVINSYFMEYDPQILSNLFTTLILSILSIAIGLGVSILFTFRKKDDRTAIIRFAMGFSNAAYMGFPLVSAIFGAEGLLYASIYVSVFTIVLWTIGFAIVNSNAGRKEIAKSLFGNPVLYAVILGLVIFLFQISVPDLLRQPISLIGNMNTPLAMFITGIIIAESNIPSLLRNTAVWKTVAVRLLVIPVICIGVFALLGQQGIVPQVVIVLQAAPTAAITSVFAVKYHHDEKLAAGTVVMTTLCCIVTLPLCTLLLSHFM